MPKKTPSNKAIISMLQGQMELMVTDIARIHGLWPITIIIGMQTIAARFLANIDPESTGRFLEATAASLRNEPGAGEAGHAAIEDLMRKYHLMIAPPEGTA